MSVEQWSDLLFSEAGGSDAHVWGSVKSVNNDGSYEVQLNASSVTTRCAAGCTAGVGDRVLVCIMANGRCAAVSRLEGEFAEFAKPVILLSSLDVDGEAKFAKPVTMQSTLNVDGALQTGASIYLPNDTPIYANSTSGSGLALVECNTNDNLLFGYGTYRASSGISYYAGNNVQIKSKNDIKITSPTAGLTERAYGVNKVLWSGTLYMNAGQTATLSEAVSAQPNGIVLVWSYYSNSAAQDTRWTSYFIPKGAVHLHPSEMHVCGHIGQTLHMAKWVLISDTSIKGYGSQNSANFTMDGVTVYNSGFVLRHVIGV